MIIKVFNFILGILVWLIGFIVNLLLQALPSGIMPNLASATDAINTFWEYAFNYMSWICNALCLSPIHIRLLIDILTIRLLTKPIIAVVKIVVNWFMKNRDSLT